MDHRPYYSYWTYSGAPLSSASWNTYIQNKYAGCASVSSLNYALNDNSDTQYNDFNEGLETDDSMTEAGDISDTNSNTTTNNSMGIFSLCFQYSFFFCMSILCVIWFFLWRGVSSCFKL